MLCVFCTGIYFRDLRYLRPKAGKQAQNIDTPGENINVSWSPSGSLIACGNKKVEIATYIHVTKTLKFKLIYASQNVKIITYMRAENIYVTRFVNIYLNELHRTLSLLSMFAKAPSCTTGNFPTRSKRISELSLNRCVAGQGNFPEPKKIANRPTRQLHPAH